jgi:hypothetical protein
MRRLIFVALAINFVAGASAQYQDYGFVQTTTLNHIHELPLANRIDYQYLGNNKYRFTINNKVLETKFIWGSTMQDPPAWNPYLATLMTTPDTITSSIPSQTYENVVSATLYWKYDDKFSTQSFSGQLTRTAYETLNPSLNLDVVSF